MELAWFNLVPEATTSSGRVHDHARSFVQSGSMTDRVQFSEHFALESVRGICLRERHRPATMSLQSSPTSRCTGAHQRHSGANPRFHPKQSFESPLGLVDERSYKITNC